MAPDLNALIDRVVDSSIERALEPDIQQHAARVVGRFVELAIEQALSDTPAPVADEDVDDPA